MSGSNQSLRDAAYRIVKPHLSTSRSSLNSEQRLKDETADTNSTKPADKQDKTSKYPTWSSG